MIVRLFRVRLISVFLITLLSVIFMRCAQSDTNYKNVILWSNSRKYERAIKAFPISTEEALKKLISKTRHRDEYFYRNPLFIVGDNYFFTTKPMKEAVRLEGFYVNGHTGVIELRKSTVVTTKKLRTIPPNAFSEVEIIE